MQISDCMKSSLCCYFCLILCFQNYITFLEFIHVVVCSYILFIITTEDIPSCLLYHKLFIHSPVDGYLGCFQLFALMSSAAMKIHRHISWGTCAGS